ncbi:uncharacterized protein [Dysidea avara]|uniref:uncharacterized protein n=1 Tax=Dysidea avara TaxID=196820 RepID=UPI0033293754
MDSISKQEVDVDTYKGEIAVKMDEVWELAKNNIKKAQRSQKFYYDQQSKPSKFKVGDRVLVYIPAAKACKAYKFARPFHGPYRILEQNEIGVTICPVDKPHAEPIQVAYDRVRHCSELLPDKFWPTKAIKNNKKQLLQPVSEEIAGITDQQTNINSSSTPDGLYDDDDDDEDDNQNQLMN